MKTLIVSEHSEFGVQGGDHHAKGKDQARSSARRRSRDDEGGADEDGDEARHAQESRLSAA